VRVLVSPYSEEWGSHSYSVAFYPSYAQVNRENWQFSLEVGIITILSVTVIAAIALLSILNERYKMHKEERDKLEAIDKQRQEFIMLVAHNLRTPITIIQGYISLLADMDISAEQKKMLEPVTETVRTLYLLVEQIVTITDVLGQDSLSFAKQDINLKEMIANIINEYQGKISEKELQVSQTHNPENMLIYTNERYIKMVFTFLIENAIKFNKTKGKISIKSYQENNNAVLSVTDTGIGINKAEQENIFVKFHKSDIKKSMYEFNYKGSGLGLYTAKVLVNALGGKIWFESIEGVGTTFYVSLPQKLLSSQN
jgi:signal transduction histidine kinase